MREHGVDESIIRSTASHGWGLTAANIKPEHQMEKCFSLSMSFPA